MWVEVKGILFDKERNFRWKEKEKEKEDMFEKKYYYFVPNKQVQKKKGL